MEHDILIKDGIVVDGTGASAKLADVAISNGIITDVGKIDGKAKEIIDAEGQTVTPGFVDTHTHLDAQIGWDPELRPVSQHGVTSVLMGNCGVTFAPCKPEDRELIAHMMQTVEDIPKDAILGGLPWDWEDYGEYLSSIENLDLGINVAGMVGHTAVRYYVMGERSVEEMASEEEIKQMAEIVGKSMDAGAVGFSTNRYPPHVGPDGRSIPGTYAEKKELIEIAKVVGQKRGLMQNVLDFGGQWDFSVNLLKDLAKTSQNRILFSIGTGPDKGSGERVRALLDHLCEEGRDITGLSQPRSSGFMFGLQSALPFPGPSWDQLRKLNLEGRLKAIRDLEFRDKLIEDAKSAKDSLPYHQVFWLGNDEAPAYAAGKEKCVAEMIKKSEEHPSELFLRLSDESDGKTLFNYKMFNQNLDEAGEMFKSERIFPGLGDAGAHVSQICDAGWATFVLSHWVREAGIYSLEEGVRRITSAPARIIGLKDRGTLEPGKRADINVFDSETVCELQPEIVHDFPGGAPRYVQGSKGYKATVVNGRINFIDGELTGIANGQVLRHSV
ncbi:MAG: amidohydrolase family protein [Gammaproteobacteria bacterium]